MEALQQTLRVVFATVLLRGLTCWAGSSATQTVTFSVNVINEISISGSPSALAVSTSTAGAAPNSVSDSSTRYAITTNGSNRKITAELDQAMPAGVTLKVNLAAPTGASSAGPVVLETTAADVVTGITGLNQRAKGITYELSATPAAGTVGSQQRVITFTVTTGTI